MARYLIRLGRETGHGRHWNRALAMLDAHPRPPLPAGPDAPPLGRGSTNARASRIGWPAGVWGLHAMLVDTMLDFAGLDYDALERRLTLEPALPSPGRTSGLSQHVPLRRGRATGSTARSAGRSTTSA